MTTLPTRPYGVMTPEERAKKIGLALCEPINSTYIQDPELQECEQADLDMIAAEIRDACAHTRERCAKWHDEQAVSIAKAAVGEKDGQRATMLISLAQEHMISADALRKLEI